jgi:peroxiredoxin
VEYSLGGCRLYADQSLQEEQQNMKTSLRAVARVLPYFALALALIFVASFARVQAADDQPMPTVGAMAPDFTLNSQENTPVSLHDFKGKWVVLYFYPKDQTPGCTIEAHGFTRDQDQYVKKNAVVLGVSVDTVDSHKEFCAKDGINFKLLSESDERHLPRGPQHVLDRSQGENREGLREGEPDAPQRGSAGGAR